MVGVTTMTPAHLHQLGMSVTAIRGRSPVTLVLLGAGWNLSQTAGSTVLAPAAAIIAWLALPPATLRGAAEGAARSGAAPATTQKRGAPEMTVRQLRVVVRCDDYEAAVAFYRDVLGLAEEAAYAGADDARVMILDAGRATLELANPAQVRMIDQVEVGHEVSPHIRIAFEVTDAERDTDALARAGAEVIAPPTQTPWRSLNARLAGPGDLQLTLFEELGPG
jgi:catechol 2,3-dioxygenase-like lactoylglutathione lyase family enzyme